MSSASQWKRCFTNPDSWTKWNIFSALFPGLELSGSLHPHIQGQPTPHLSVTHKEQEKKWGFSCKNVVALWVCRVWQRKSQTPVLPIYLTEVRGFSKDSSTRILSSCSLSHGNSPCLWFCWMESNKPSNPSSKPRLEVRDSRRGHWKGKVVPTAPPVLWHVQVWGVLPRGKEIPR